jgi:hypothetical protein
VHHIYYVTQLICCLGKFRINSNYEPLSLELFVRGINVIDANDIAGFIVFVRRCLTLDPKLLKDSWFCGVN